MRKNPLLLPTILFLLLFGYNSSAQTGNTEQFKKTMYAQLKYLQPQGFERRTVKFISVVQGATTGGYQNFKVTAYIHDYDEGYAPNSYWGQTCLSKIDGLPYTMHKDPFGQWLVQGKFTMSGRDSQCEDNPSNGASALPIDGVPGAVYSPGNTTAAKTQTQKPVTVPSAAGQLYIGEYACYGTGNRIMAGMGFTLLAGGKYYDGDGKRGGSYSYNAAAGVINFKGGFLSGQKGTHVTLGGFDISATVFAEPWK